MVTLAEVRRFLHCNYNCVDLDNLERWYTELFALEPVMRSDTTDTDGRPFGMHLPMDNRTVFLYDQRGARVATSLEVVGWRNPPTVGRAYDEPWYHGIQSIAYRVPDLDEVLGKVPDRGGRVVRRVDDVALVEDPEGLKVEVVAAAGETAEAHHLRLVCSDLGRSRAWYESLGFTPSANHPVLPSAALWDGGADHQLTAEQPMVATDEQTFALLLTTWSGPPPIGPPYSVPFHQGIFRMAVAVDDVRAAYERLREAGVAKQPPYTFPLPGTPIDEGLTILFIHDPDGVMVELVERPRSFFKPS